MMRSAASGLAGGLAVLAAAALISPFGGGRTVVARPAAGAQSAFVSSGGILSAKQIYAKAAPAVVAIATSASGGGPFGGGGRASGSGAGIVISSSGLIVTNDHVIDGASTITVTLGGAGGPTLQATVVGQDASSDIAVIKINPAGQTLHPLALGDSSAVQVGDATYAIGNPYGLDQTLTTGVVSALQRQINAPNGAVIKHVIQTDAALNPGNSGGPLLDASGNVIGINSQIAASQDGGSSGNSGIGFAIPSNTVKSVVARIAGHA
jgi:putative serine protease PepD